MNSSLDGSWEDARRERLLIDDHECVECGKTDDLQVHHIKPVSEGGSNELNNLLTLCAECHGGKHPKISSLIESDNRQKGVSKGTVRYTPTVREVERILANTPHPQARLFILLASKLHLRAFEISNLGLDQIHLTKGGFGLTEVSERHHSYIELPKNKRACKGARHTRTHAPLDREVEYALLRYLLIRPDTKHNRLIARLTKGFGDVMEPKQIRDYIRNRTDNGVGVEDLNAVFSHHYPGDINVKRHITGKVYLSEVGLGRVVTDYREMIYKFDWNGEKQKKRRQLRKQSKKSISQRRSENDRVVQMDLASFST